MAALIRLLPLSVLDRLLARFRPGWQLPRRRLHQRHGQGGAMLNDPLFIVAAIASLAVLGS
jgi:hypothetical protein